MKISIIVGTRPEIIKMSSVIRKCEQLGINFYILHTGQHYSYEMDQVFFEELKIPLARYHLDVGSGSHGRQTGEMLAGIEEVLLKDRPDMVLVQGDTNTTLAGALAAVKLHIPIGHVEAGLRCFDRSMPEEVNRVIVDHISDYLFAPTERSHKNLINEGIPEKKIFITQNTIADAVYQSLAIANEGLNVLESFGLTEGEYFLTTAHRAENVDNPERLGGILEGLRRVHHEFRMPVIFPAHPRTVKMMKKFGLEAPAGTLMIKPVGYLEFLQLISGARIVISDSGGVQEEACILGIGCVTIRNNTERPETIDVGANILAGVDSEKITDGVRTMMQVVSDWMHPYGNGKAAEKIVELILQDYWYESESKRI